VDENFKKRMDFIVEVDKLKNIFRQSMVLDKSRNENDAEHSWHLALMSFILLDYAKFPNLDLVKVLKMVLIHDIVEIDAGDTFCYDEKENTTKRSREEKAARRIFGLLPDPQKNEYIKLWEEFEERRSSEAKFAASLDRLHPMLNNYYTEGSSWKKHHVKASQVFERNEHMKEGSPLLWEFAQEIIKDSIKKGYLEE
jgi:putative hydrolases of HD superfamily